MASQTETKLKLDAPEALTAVEPEQAAGLVPLKEEQKSALEERVDGFVSELVALDANSPEFGKKVDQLTTMGRKEIVEAASHSNRVLDRPVKAIDTDTGIGADLTQLRRTVEDLDPARGIGAGGGAATFDRTERAGCILHGATGPPQRRQSPALFGPF